MTYHTTYICIYFVFHLSCVWHLIAPPHFVVMDMNCAQPLFCSSDMRKFSTRVHIWNFNLLGLLIVYFLVDQVSYLFPAWHFLYSIKGVLLRKLTADDYCKSRHWHFLLHEIWLRLLIFSINLNVLFVSSLTISHSIKVAILRCFAVNSPLAFSIKSLWHFLFHLFTEWLCRP